MLPNLGQTIRDWRSNHDGKDDPENHFDELTSALKDFRAEMLDYPDAITKIDAAMKEIADLIDELRSEMPEEPDSDDFTGRASAGIGNDDSRSIFDDVDA